MFSSASSHFFTSISENALFAAVVHEVMVGKIIRIFSLSRFFCLYSL